MNEPTTRNADGKPHTVTRRTIVKGVAWSIPVVAASVSAPLAAASTVTSISFTAASYAATSCGVVNVSVIALNGASPSKNSPVTITLPAGLLWPDGTTTPKTLTTDATGQVTFTVKAPANNGTFTILADSGTATASATVTVTGNPAGNYVWQNFNNTSSDRSTTYANVPASAKPLGNNFFLINGTLWWGNSANKGGKVIATGVTQAVSFHSESNGHDADWITMLVNGTWTSFYGNTGGNGTYTTYPNVPSSATALQNFSFLDGTDLYYGNTKVLSNVTNAYGYFGGNADYVDVLIGGIWYTYNNQNGFNTPLYTSPAVPAGATPLGNQYYLSNGTLYWRTNSTPVATGVTKAVAFRSPNSNYVDALVNGVWTTYSDGGSPTTFASVPAGATPLENHYFLLNGSLYYKNTVIATSITTAQGYYGGDQGSHADFANFNQSGTCP